MQVGIRDAVIRVPGDTRPLTAIYHDHLERIILADELGYDFTWFGEHHFMANQLGLLGGPAERAEDDPVQPDVPEYHLGAGALE